MYNVEIHSESFIIVVLIPTLYSVGLYEETKKSAHVVLFRLLLSYSIDNLHLQHHTVNALFFPFVFFSVCFSVCIYKYISMDLKDQDKGTIDGHFYYNERICRESACVPQTLKKKLFGIFQLVIKL